MKLSIEPELRKLIDNGNPPDEARRLLLFAERLFARESPEFRERVNAAEQLAIARALFDFFSVRREPIVIRVHPGAGGETTTVVEVVMPDCQFIVDSQLEYFRSRHAEVLLMLHPIFQVSRDLTGQIATFEQSVAAERGESLTLSELELPYSEALADELTRDLISILREVQQSTADFDAMKARALRICEETAAQRALVEVRDFLRWLVQGGFVFLGYRSYSITGDGARARFKVDVGSELGVMRDHDESRFRDTGLLDDIDPARRELFFSGAPVIVGKSRVESHVHRRRPMDSISIRRTGAGGRVTGFDNFVGLFTSKAYAEESEHIPLLRAKLKEVLEAEHAQPGSHDYKEIVSVFNSFPKDELFRAPIDELRKQLRLVLDVKSEGSVRLSIIADEHRGHVIILIVMPRDAFSAEVRHHLQDILGERLGGALLYYYLALGEGYTARLHFAFAAPPPKPALVRQLETEVGRIARRWDDRVRDELIARFGAARGRTLTQRWAPAFDAEYKAAVRASRAALDIEHLENLLSTGKNFVVELQPTASHGEGLSELRMIGLGQAPMLSALMPTLQNFSIEVVAEHAHDLKPTIDGKPASAYVQAFSVRAPGEQPFASMPGAKLIADAIGAVRDGLTQDDPLNALTLLTGLTWRQVTLIRTYLVVAFQMRLAPARLGLQRLLLNNIELARMLTELFVARLDPDRDTAAEEIAALRAAYLERVGKIDNIVDDRTARALLSMVEATVRTNYFCALPEPDPYLALKFESSKILGLPDTPPLYEIHVNSPRMEGCHLRAGRIARGGIRFSDRIDDYRTEILDLMKTQTVKNAIIVPIGSKGGFVVKPRPGVAPDARDGVEAYKTLMNAMLDLTDNLTDNGVVHPPRVKVLDDDGAYLVVAADKGTASFSDVANAIALERGFWLGDAFASGGEHGYDHKKLGITARGAWESARRHLRELGRDIDRGAPIIMAGIGDMSGDVFGNGLLLSRNLKLVAAFDHRHIFIDPDPDPAASFDERRRLFDLPRSSWADYNSKLISAGGGVFRRGQKRIELSEQARTALACEEDAPDGETLIAAILRAPVELLYNGGIGTYVRAASETDAEVGDHANDACRITAGELRAKVVVEGGNLGFTQKARIEYALAGGRINTDAIDNSAGVDMSDHEVNLKILLEPAVARGELKFEVRNKVLSSAGDDIAERVIDDNRDQVLSLSLEQARSRHSTSVFYDHLKAIDDRGLLRHHDPVLPQRDVLEERRARFTGLARPELAVITAFTKIDLVQELESTALVEDPYLIERFLRPYFPDSIAARFEAEVGHHRLRHELVATEAANQLVDLMGSTLVFELTREFGVKSNEAVRGWLIAADILGIEARVKALKAGAATMTAEAEIESFLALGRACRASAEWAVANVEPAISLGEAISRFKPPFEALLDSFELMLIEGDRARLERIYRELRPVVADGELAHSLVRLMFADHLLTILSLAFRRGMAPDRVMEAYFKLSAVINFAILEQGLEAIASDDRWIRRAVQELAAELRATRIALCGAVLDDSGRSVEEAITRMKETRAARLADVERLFVELSALKDLTPAALHVTIRSLTRLAEAPDAQAR
jgi:glutamate dehydrogenase